MAITTKTKTKQCASIQVVNDWVLPFGSLPYATSTSNVAGPITVLTDTVVTDSISSPNYYMRRPVRYRWKPHWSSRYFPVPPLKPEPWKPGVGPKKPVLRYVNPTSRQLKSFGKAMKKWTTRYNTWYQSKELKRKARYDTRLKNYEKRLKTWQAITDKIASGVIRNRVKPVMRYSTVKPNNPYSRVSTRCTPITGTFHTDRWFNPYTVLAANTVGEGVNNFNKIIGALNWCIDSTFWDPDPAALGAASESARSRALSNCLQKLNQFDLHVGNIAAERHRTISMFKSLISVLTHPKHALYTIVTGKMAADVWLMFCFGVRPLINDFYAACEALAKLQYQDLNDRVEVRASAQGRCSSRGSRTVLSNGLPFYTITSEVDHTVKVSYVLEYDVTNGALAILNQLGLVNPAEIAWEMMPWSFVIDWILPVGTWLANMGADNGLTFRVGTKVTTTTSTYVMTYDASSCNNPNPHGPNQFTQLNARGLKKIETKIREVLFTAPLTPLPDYKNPYSLLHLSESIALAVQFKAGARRRVVKTADPRLTAEQKKALSGESKLWGDNPL